MSFAVCGLNAMQNSELRKDESNKQQEQQANHLAQGQPPVNPFLGNNGHINFPPFEGVFDDYRKPNARG